MFIARLLVKMISPKVHIRATNEGSEFEWDTNTIWYDESDDPADIGFTSHLKECHNFAEPEKFSSRLWSILHELGHYFNPDEEVDYNAKAVCSLVPYEVAIKDKKIQYAYYNSPDEFAATEWACAWIENHPHLARVFSKLL